MTRDFFVIDETVGYTSASAPTTSPARPALQQLVDDLTAALAALGAAIMEAVRLLSAAFTSSLDRHHDALAEAEHDAVFPPRPLGRPPARIDPARGISPSPLGRPLFRPMRY